MSIIICKSGNCEGEGNRINIEIGNPNMSLEEWKSLYEKIFGKPCPHERIVDIYREINDYLNRMAQEISQELEGKFQGGADPASAGS